MTKTEFRNLYHDCLIEAVTQSPAEYPWLGGTLTVDIVTDRMIAALDRGSANITGSNAFRKLAKRLGIKHTVRDITAVWKALEA